MVKLITPRVFKIAESSVDYNGIESMLLAVGGTEAKSWLDSKNEGDITSEGEFLIEVAGRTCYKSWAPGLNPNVTKIRQNSKDYFQNILKSGDGSILEHSTVTFAIIGCSRVFTHELVRHRVGVAYSQESLRYVRIEELPFTTLKIPSEPGGFLTSSDWEEKLKKNLNDTEASYLELVNIIPWGNLSFNEKKKLTSYLRRRLPQGMATNIIFTANHRILRWLLEARTHPAAEIEIRTIFGMIGEILLRDYPILYQDFVKEALPDGTWQFKPTLRSKV